MAGVAGISWLKSKPRTLPGMDDTLNRVIARQGWPFAVKFSGARTSWEDWDSPFALDLRDLVVTGGAGEYTISVPRAVVKFRILPLLKGQLKFRDVILIEPKVLWVVPVPENETKPQIEGVDKTLAAQWKILQRNPVYLAGLNAIFDILEQPTLMPLKRLEARDLAVEIALEEESRTIEREKVSFAIRNTDEGAELKLSSIQRINGKSAIFDVQLGQESNNSLWAKASVENFSTSAISAASTELGWYSRLGLFFTGEFNTIIHRSGRIEKASFGIAATPNSTLQFSLSGGLKNTPLYQAASNIPDVEAQIEINNLPVERIAAYWPYDMGVNARSWVTQNLTQGVVSRATADIKMPPSFWMTGILPVDGIRAEVPFEQLDIKIAPDLPPIKKAKGVAAFTRDTMRIIMDEATIKNSTIRQGATAFIPNLGGEEIEQMEIKASADGPISDLLSFYAIQQEKLGKKSTFDAGKIKGKAASDFTVNFPLLQDLRIADIVYTVHSDISNFDYPDVAQNISLSNAQFTLDYKDKAMTVGGVGALNGVETKINYKTSEKEERTADSEMTLLNTMQVTDLPKLGFPKIEQASGAIAMNYLMRQQQGNRVIVINLDAQDAAITYPDIGFNKPVKEPLNVKLVLEGTGEEVPTLKAFQADGKNIKAKGTADFDAAGNLKEVLLSEMAFDKNEGQLKIIKEGDRYILQVAAQTLNLEPIIRYYNENKTDDKKDSKTSFTLKGTSKTVLMANGEQFTNVAGDLTCVADKCLSATLNAKSRDNTNLTISLVPSAKENVLSVNAENAGAVLRALDVIKDIRGGTMTTRAIQNANVADAPFTGNLIIKDFRIVGTPILARLLTLGSLTGIVDTLNGNGIAFTKLDGRYTYGQKTYQLNDFKLYGSSIGILVNGYANLKDSLIKLSGTLIPAYAINSAIGKVPIVGQLLGDGVFATSFSVDGKIDNPDTKVYPLSTIAPGILSDFMRSLGALPPEKVNQQQPKLLSPSPPTASEKKASGEN